MIVRRMPSSELYHHGIKGQEWGEQNGPPYPLDSQTSAAVKKSAKKKNFIERARDKRKMRALRRAKDVKKQEQQKREEIIRSGDINAINKIKHTLTDDEMNRAVARINLNLSMEQAMNAKSELTHAKVTRAIDKISKVALATSNVSTAAKNVHDALTQVGVLKDKKKEAEAKMQALKDASAIKEMNAQNAYADYMNTVYTRANLDFKKQNNPAIQKQQAKKAAKEGKKAENETPKFVKVPNYGKNPFDPENYKDKNNKDDEEEKKKK